MLSIGANVDMNGLYTTTIMFDLASNFIEGMGADVSVLLKKPSACKNMMLAI